MSAPSIESPSATSAPRSSRSADVALASIYEISKLLTAPAGLEPTLSGVLTLLSSFIDVRHSMLALLDDLGSPELVIGAGWTTNIARSYFDWLPERVIGRVVVGQVPLVIERVREHPLFDATDWSEWGPSEGELSLVGVPIKDRGRVVGVIFIDREWRNSQEYQLDEDARLLTMVANLIGQTVRLHRLVARDRQRLMSEQHRLTKAVARSAPEPPGSNPLFGGIIGQTEAIRAVLDRLKLAARSHSTVLLRGESGTGKEMLAKILHELSPRRERAFVAVNCAALSESVLESELFGHERGAFTGAVSQRKGRFELADGGTLFLDEIGEISPAFQAKLLRVLQLGEFERVGGSSTLKVDVRFVAATNRDLEAAVSDGSFRADLYYRVSVVPISVPPLRDRTGDIPPLAQEFLQRFDREHDTQHVLTQSALDVLTSCYFPGNVRELENCVRRTATLTPGPSIRGQDFACRNDQCLSAVLWRGPRRPEPNHPAAGAHSVPPVQTSAPAAHSASRDSAPTESAPTENAATQSEAMPERERLIAAMESAGWVQAKAARLLGITPRQIGYALRKHQIRVKKF